MPGEMTSVSVDETDLQKGGGPARSLIPVGIGIITNSHDACEFARKMSRANGSLCVGVVGIVCLEFTEMRFLGFNDK